MASSKVGSVSVGLLLFVCISLLSVEFAESRGAARRHNAVRSGRSGSNKQLKRDDVFKTRCCMSIGAAVIKEKSASVSVYNSNQELIDSQREDESSMIATDGWNELRINEGTEGVFLTIPNMDTESDCTEICYSAITYYIKDLQNKCYDSITSTHSQYPIAGSCPIELNDAQSYETDKTGITTAEGTDPQSGNEATAKFKYVDNACVPIGVDFKTVVGDGFERDTTVVYDETIKFQEARFEALYNDLLALTHDDMKQCPDEE